MKEYYATLCEFYLDGNVSNYLSPEPSSVMEGLQHWTDENGDEYEIFHEYQYCEYDLIARIGELSDDALRLFQRRICRNGPIPFFEHNRCISIITRIVDCTVGHKPQWNGDKSITFPYKQIVNRKQKAVVNYDRNIHVNLAIWLREFNQPSLEEQLDLSRKVRFGDTLLQHPEVASENAVYVFFRQILKTCLDVASEIREVEANTKRKSSLNSEPAQTGLVSQSESIPMAVKPDDEPLPVVLVNSDEIVNGIVDGFSKNVSRLPGCKQPVETTQEETKRWVEKNKRGLTASQIVDDEQIAGDRQSNINKVQQRLTRHYKKYPDEKTNHVAQKK